MVDDDDDDDDDVHYNGTVRTAAAAAGPATNFMPKWLIQKDRQTKVERRRNSLQEVKGSELSRKLLSIFPIKDESYDPQMPTLVRHHLVEDVR